MIIGNPWLLNRVLNDPDTYRSMVIKKYGMAKGLPVVRPDELFGQKYKNDVPLFTFLDGGSLVTDILLLRSLAGKFKDCSYFEIGTWRGESVYNISDIARECYSLNLSDDELADMKVSEKFIGQQ